MLIKKLIIITNNAFFILCYCGVVPEYTLHSKFIPDINETRCTRELTLGQSYPLNAEICDLTPFCLVLQMEEWKCWTDGILRIDLEIIWVVSHTLQKV